MTRIRQDIDNVVAGVMVNLKDFQQATVKHIDSLYRKGQKRILVSDEVGLGKTLVARGLVANLARLRLEEGDNLFKVIYICSNAAIANQNIRKLQITSKTNIESTQNSRLSMQHLNIFRQEHDPELLEGFIQLIPLTPDTSLRMTSGGGSVNERALMFAILKQLPSLTGHLEALEVLMTDDATISWHRWAKSYYEDLVQACEKATGGKYLAFMLNKVADYLKSDDLGLLHRLFELLNKIEQAGFARIKSHSLIKQLRIMFAKISIDLLEPDFVIMDEFQRFKFLLESSEESEAGLLAQRFFKGKNLRMLLLSATPYKMYSTLEEIDELNVDEHYSEFFNVINFLKADEDEQRGFREIWHNYSITLQAFSKGDTTIVRARHAAEDALFDVVSRTERISATEIADMINDDSTSTHLMPQDTDIASYIAMQTLLQKTVKNLSLPVDYVKSSPYLLSFMRDYQLKKRLEAYFAANPNKVTLARNKHLWIQPGQIREFKKIDPSNARLDYLQREVFEQNAEQLLWVPPSRPYYELTGPFRMASDFSKFIVFSAWEMVPRMIATMISYESERRNAQILARRLRHKSQEVRYFSSDSGSKRYPAARLNFSLSLGEPKGMPLFCFLYPAKRLGECFEPIAAINKNMNLSEIESHVQSKVQHLLDELNFPEVPDGREDERWYYLAPLLFDDRDYVSNWLSMGDSLAEFSDPESGQADHRHHTPSGFRDHLEALRKMIDDPEISLGRQPSDLLDVLVNMALASPAISAMRTYQMIGGDGYRDDMPSQLAKIFLNRMNTPESTAVIEVVYGKSGDDAHWKNLLHYCKAGNLQAVFDEYAHILVESNGLSNADNKTAPLHDLIMASLNVRTASYQVDTFNAFRARTRQNKSRTVNIRSHFAVAFTKSDAGTGLRSDRRESVRNSFNSPFRPFVLASTSIGQEGLDFHYYCRKIVHWNLPSNPIDIEQREGRINRYKCLAIRQNVARRYVHSDHKKDVWHEMFSAAYINEKQENGSDLIPFWGLTPSENMIKIERIVPMYPFSQDVVKYERLIKILSLYRLTLGQPRQEELLEHLFKNHDEATLHDLFINLSPFYKLRSKDA